MWFDFRYELIWVGDEQNGQAGDHFRYEIIWVGKMGGQHGQSDER